MTLASFDFFAAVKASHPGNRGRLDALAVETTGCWMLVALHPRAHQSAQHMMNALPVSQAAKPPEVVINRLPRRKLTRQMAPLHTCHRNIPKRVEHRVTAARRTPHSFFWQQRFDNLLLCLGEVHRVSWFFHTSQFTLSSRNFQNSFLAARKLVINWAQRRLLLRLHWLSMFACA